MFFWKYKCKYLHSLLYIFAEYSNIFFLHIYMTSCQQAPKAALSVFCCCVFVYLYGYHNKKADFSWIFSVASEGTIHFNFLWREFSIDLFDHCANCFKILKSVNYCVLFEDLNMSLKLFILWNQIKIILEEIFLFIIIRNQLTFTLYSKKLQPHL